MFCDPSGWLRSDGEVLLQETWPWAGQRLTQSLHSFPLPRVQMFWEFCFWPQITCLEITCLGHWLSLSNWDLGKAASKFCELRFYPTSWCNREETPTHKGLSPGFLPLTLLLGPCRSSVAPPYFQETELKQIRDFSFFNNMRDKISYRGSDGCEKSRPKVKVGLSVSFIWLWLFVHLCVCWGGEAGPSTPKQRI